MIFRHSYFTRGTHDYEMSCLCFQFFPVGLIHREREREPHLRRVGSEHNRRKCKRKTKRDTHAEKERGSERCTHEYRQCDRSKFSIQSYWRKRIPQIWTADLQA